MRTLAIVNSELDKWIAQIRKLIRRMDAIDGGSSGSSSSSSPSVEYTQHFNGLVDGSLFDVTYSATTRQFTVVAQSDASYYSGSTKYTVGGVLSSPDAHADTLGVYWLYFDGATLTVGTDPDLNTVAVLANVYYVPGSPAKYVLFDERHPDTWPPALWEHFHHTQGSQYISGGVISGYSPGSNSTANTTFAISACVMEDESYRHTVAALADGGPYSIWYRTGADTDSSWGWDTTPTVPYIASAGEPCYNRLNAGSWNNDPITTNNYYVNYWLLATNAWQDGGDNAKHRFIIIEGQAVHTSTTTAYAEVVTSSLSFGTFFPITEFTPLYRITWERQTGSPANARINLVTRIVGTNTRSLTL